MLTQSPCIILNHYACMLYEGLQIGVNPIRQRDHGVTNAIHRTNMATVKTYPTTDE